MRPVPERVAAQAAGEKFYFTGKPCRNGHVERRYTSNGLCATCQSQKTAKWTAKREWHPARLAAKEAGERHFTTGAPCGNGHTCMRYTANGHCIECSTATHRRWLDARPGLEAEWKRNDRAKNPAKHRETAKRYRERHPEKVKQISRESRARWAERYPDRALKSSREGALKWRHANQERANAIRRKSYHRDIVKSRKQAVAAAATRRTRMIGTFTENDINRLLSLQRERCAECKKPLRKFHVDHIMPLALKGLNDFTNLQLLCPTCNMRKGASDPYVWAQKNGRLL